MRVATLLPTPLRSDSNVAPLGPGSLLNFHDTVFGYSMLDEKPYGWPTGSPPTAVPTFISPPRERRRVFTVITVIRSIEVGLMARIDLFAKIPLIGMSLVFLAMFIVAVTAYLHVGWYSIIGYAIAAVTAVAGFVMTFRDVRDTPGPPEQWDVRGTPIDPASPRN